MGRCLVWRRLFKFFGKNLNFFFEKSVSYQKKNGRGHGMTMTHDIFAKCSQNKIYMRLNHVPLKWWGGRQMGIWFVNLFIFLKGLVRETEFWKLLRDPCWTSLSKFWIYLAVLGRGCTKEEENLVRKEVKGEGEKWVPCHCFVDYAERINYSSNKRPCSSHPFKITTMP